MSDSIILNHLGKKYGEKLTTSEMLEGVAQVDPYIWHCIYRRVKGRPSTFNLQKEFEHYAKIGKEISKRDILRHRPFLIQPLRDHSKIKAYLKARQLGVSEIMISEEVWFLSTHPHTKWMHTFHRKESAEDFSTTRIDEALSETERIRALRGKPFQVTTKRIEDGYLFIRSSQSAGMGEGTDIDGITFDEKDRMPPGVEDAFKEGLESSNYGLIRVVSTPSLPGRGVSVYWERSDKKYWFVRCTRCGLKQPILYPDNYIQVKDMPKGKDLAPEGTWAFLCRKEKCRGKLERVIGEWVPERPDADEVSGYAMPQALFMNHTCTSIMNKRARMEHISLWENYVLGIPSQSSTSIINDEDIEKASVPYPWPIQRRGRDWVDVCAGIDWGHANWCVVIGRNAHNNRVYVLNAFRVDDTGQSVESAREIIRRLQVYDPDMVVADAGFGRDRNPLLKEVFGEKFWVCKYNSASVKKQTTSETKWAEKDGMVTIDRTLTLTTMCNHIRLGRVGFPSEDREESLELKKHLLNLQPMIHEEKGEMWTTIEAVGHDHLAHALGYALLANYRLGASSSFDFEFLSAGR